MTRVARAALCLAALALAVPASAQALVDPTRPPDAIELESPSAAGATSRLESVLLSPRRKIAVIDGVPVPLGGKLGEATLISIGPTEVVLRERDGDRVLKLHPAVEKKTNHGAAPAGGDRGGKR